MAKKVIVDNVETGKKEEVVLSDAVEQLIAAGRLQNDDEGVFFQRQLEFIQSKSYDKLYPQLMGRTLFPNNFEGGEGIQNFTYRSFDRRGSAVLIAGKATDLPRADIDGKEFTIPVKQYGNAYGYSYREIASAKVTGLPLEARKAEAARLAYEELINQIILFGDKEAGIAGFFDGPAGSPCLTITKTQVAAPAAGADRTWRGGDKTPDEIIADLNNALNKMYVETKKIFRPETILMNVANKQFLMNTPRSTTSDTSIMSWFLANNSFIKSADQIKDINELEGIYDQAGGDFAPDGSKGEGFSVLAAGGSDNAQIREPFPYTAIPVQFKGLEFEINCYGHFAGIEMYRPAAFQHFYGI